MVVVMVVILVAPMLAVPGNMLMGLRGNHWIKAVALTGAQMAVIAQRVLEIGVRRRCRC
jgi:hypothetical protein